MTVFEDMRRTAQAHEQWAQSPEATADEAATSTVFAAQIRDWLHALGAVSLPIAVDPVVQRGQEGTTRDTSSEGYQEALHRPKP